MSKRTCLERLMSRSRDEKWKAHQSVDQFLRNPRVETSRIAALEAAAKECAFLDALRVVNEAIPDPAVEFELTLFDDTETRQKLGVLSRFEAMFDDSRNELPPEYYKLTDELPFGSTIRVTMEVIKQGAAEPDKE